MNAANPGNVSSHWTLPGPSNCDGTSTDPGCAYNYGWNAAQDALTYANAQAINNSATWWLDIESANSWSSDATLNVADIQGMIDALQASYITVGIYAAPNDWASITANARIDVANWIPGAANVADATSWCTPARSVTGGPVTLVQFPDGAFDGDVHC